MSRRDAPPVSSAQAILEVTEYAAGFAFRHRDSQHVTTDNAENVPGRNCTSRSPDVL